MIVMPFQPGMGLLGTTEHQYHSVTRNCIGGLLRGGGATFQCIFCIFCPIIIGGPALNNAGATDIALIAWMFQGHIHGGASLHV